MKASSQRLLYVQAVLEAYLSLPDTPAKARPADRRLAGQLHQRDIPLGTVRDAILLAAARRHNRSPELPPLPPVRSLHYFLPVIEELLNNPLPAGYSRYLQRKLTAALTAAKGPEKGVS